MKRLNKVLYNYVYFNAFPVIIIVQNLSVFFFPFLIMEFFKKKNLVFKKNNINLEYAESLGYVAIKVKHYVTRQSLSSTELSLGNDSP